MELCTRCMMGEMGEVEKSEILAEIAHSDGRLIQDLLKEVDEMDSLKRRANEYRNERLKERERKLAQYEGQLKQLEQAVVRELRGRASGTKDIGEMPELVRSDERRQQIEQEMRRLGYELDDLRSEDLEGALELYIQQGYLKMEKGQVTITPRGAKKLANDILRRILSSLMKKEIGPHTVEERGYGSQLSTSSRRYELGDEYNKIDFEKTLLNALERNPGEGKMSLKVEDFQVYEEIHETKTCAGLAIDNSGSMRGEKVNAARDAGLALSELIRKEPKAKLKVYLFSDRVREIPHYDISNARCSGGNTDMRSAMQVVRKAMITEKSNKQVYLVTDTEPNTERGAYIGFNEAVGGVLEEALRYRRDGITLNIIMLDENPLLKEFASMLAKRNLGRVFFTSPRGLGEVMVEDYLVTKRRHS